MKLAAGTQGTPSTASVGGLSSAGCMNKDWTPTPSFDVDSRQQLEAIPQHERTTETPATKNLCLVFAIHQIRAPVLGGQLLPTIRTETEAKGVHAALVHKTFSALCSALVRGLGSPPGP